jgi:hypothetical protein
MVSKVDSWCRAISELSVLDRDGCWFAACHRAKSSHDQKAHTLERLRPAPRPTDGTTGPANTISAAQHRFRAIKTTAMCFSPRGILVIPTIRDEGTEPARTERLSPWIYRA